MRVKFLAKGNNTLELSPDGHPPITSQTLTAALHLGGLH